MQMDEWYDTQGHYYTDIPQFGIQGTYYCSLPEIDLPIICQPSQLVPATQHSSSNQAPQNCKQTKFLFLNGTCTNQCHYIFPAYVLSLPATSRHHLQRRLDWDNEGVDRDLHEIADHMFDWEETLSSHLGLTAADIHDITNGIRSLKLQR